MHEKIFRPMIEMSTGNPTCDAMHEIHLEGNIVPASWYQTIVKSGTKKPKPYLLAIIILADIAYWYRPAPVRSEQTGELVGYKKKFRSDLLQRNYKQLAEQFGCSAGQSKDAIVFLEELGVVKRVFRDVEVAGNTYNNVMYLALDAARLKELTYPSGESSTEGGRNSPRGVEENSLEVGEKKDPPPGENAHYTENFTLISSKISPATFSVIPSVLDGEKEFSKGEMLPDKNRIKTEITQLSEIEFRRANGFMLDADEREHTRFPVYKLAVECLIEMCSSGPQVYLGVKTDSAEIWEKVQSIVAYDQSLGSFLEEIMEDYIDTSRSREIKNARMYLKSMLWERLQTYIVRAEIL